MKDRILYQRRFYFLFIFYKIFCFSKSEFLRLQQNNNIKQEVGRVDCLLQTNSVRNKQGLARSWMILKPSLIKKRSWMNYNETFKTDDFQLRSTIYENNYTKRLHEWKKTSYSSVVLNGFKNINKKIQCKVVWQNLWSWLREVCEYFC